MPLKSGSSREVVSQNIRELHTGKTFAHTEGKFGKDRANKQAIAIALSEARKSRAVGGGVANYDAGGGVDPVNAVINALNAGVGSGLGGTIGGSNSASPSAAPAAAPAAAGNTTSVSQPTSTAAPTGSTANQALPNTIYPQGTPTLQPQPSMGVEPPPSAPGVIMHDPGPVVAPPSPPSPAATSPSNSFASPPPTVPSPATAPAIGGSGFQNQGVVPTPATTPLNTSASLLSDGGVANRAGGGGFNMAQGPAITAPWQERGAARALHVGPVLSNVPGRTDNHQVSVPTGSYVLPAAHMSSMGHGNTNAGMSLASRMFGQGPYGSGPTMKMGGHGGLPHPPKIAAPGPGIANLATGGYTYSEGGAQTGDGYDPVPVDISGGEYVIPPQEIIRRWGNLKNGHAVLDQFVMDERAKEIKTQKALPPPAKE